MTPTVISLFSGIGGLDLGFEWAGFQIVAQVEKDEFCRRVLRKHWPGVPLFEDVRHAGRHNHPDADVIMGGFPCQDVSLAGKRAGIKPGTRSGLWYEFARIIGELRPRCVVLENVPAITSLGGLSVIGDLAALGYGAEWGIVAAAGVGAPHLRERWFCVAYAGLSRRSASLGQRSGASEMAERSDYRSDERHPLMGHATEPGLQGPIQSAEHYSCSTSDQPDIESRMGRIFDGLPAWLDGVRRESRWPARPNERQHDWETPRTITGKVKDRASRIKALGNAVVPQVAYVIALAVKELLSDTD